MGQKWVKNILFQNDPGPFGMLKHVFLAHFEPVVTRFGPWQILKCFENGSFWDGKWVKNGAKTRYSKSDPGPFGMLKQLFLARFETAATCFGPWKIPKCLKNGAVLRPKRGQNGSKTRFGKSDPGPLGMHKQVKLAHFEPVFNQLSPFRHMYAPRCTLRTYLRAVQ